MTNITEVLTEKRQVMKDKVEELRKEMDANYAKFDENPDDETYLKLHKINAELTEAIGVLYTLDRAISYEKEK